jgi:hypothetical protein
MKSSKTLEFVKANKTVLALVAAIFIGAVLGSISQYRADTQEQANIYTYGLQKGFDQGFSSGLAFEKGVRDKEQNVTVSSNSHETSSYQAGYNFTGSHTDTQVDLNPYRSANK